MKSEIRYSTACKHVTGEKTLSNFIQNKKEFIEPQELTIGFDRDTEKNDTVQYIPISRTLSLLLSHEDILGEVSKRTTEHTEGVIRSYNDGEMWRENVLFTIDEPSLQLILYYDDFNVVNPLGNKVVKYKSSAFYFVLGNIPSNLRSRLCDMFSDNFPCNINFRVWASVFLRIWNNLKLVTLKWLLKEEAQFSAEHCPW